MSKIQVCSGDKNDCILYNKNPKTPWIFDIYSVVTLYIGYWVYPEDFKNYCTGVKDLSPRWSFLVSTLFINNEFPVPAWFRRLLEGKGFNGTQQFLNSLQYTVWLK